MSLKSKPTFVHEMPLRLDRMKGHAVSKRFDVAHFPYNVVVQEMLARLDAMRADLRFDVACKMPKKEPEQRTARNAVFAQLRKEYGFNEYAAHAVVSAHIKASGYLDGLIDSHTAQTLATRAFDACAKYAFGVRGRPRFKRRGEIASIEGKGPTSPLQWKDDHVVWGGKRRDRRLVLRPTFNRADKQGVEAHALASNIKYVRLLRRKIRGEWKFFVQLVCEGQPLQRFEAKQEDVAIDLGPSTAAIVSHDKAALVSFLPTIKEDLATKRRLERLLARSRRATNPQCFNANGTWKHGQRQTVFSKRYKATRATLTEQERIMAETRDRAHGRLSNIVLRDFGNQVKTEKLSKKAWQKLWGRRMKITAPATFMNKTHRKAENAGGGVIEFNAGKYKLSQLDHTRGDFVKKPLSLRWHVLRDGSGQVVQRDLYSAWLALYIQADGLDASQAEAAWAVAYPLLARAASSSVKATSGGSGENQSHSRALERVRVVRTQKQSESLARVSALAENESGVTL
jgi:putative transposase